jgi:peptidoglycan/LPS O-acetylase OafA/YrhL
LTCEAFFYLAYPFVFVPLLNPTKAKTAFFVGLSFLPAVIVLIWNRFGSVGNIVFHPLMHLPSFLLGIVFANQKSIPGRVWQSLLGCAIFIAVSKVLFRDAVPLKVGIAALPFTILIWSLASAKQPDVQSKWTKALVFQGNASYVLYLIHFPILVLLRRSGHLGSVSQGVVAVIVAVASASAFYLVFDRPFHALITQRLKARAN